MAAIARQFCRGTLAVAVLCIGALGALAQQPVTIYGLAIPDRLGGLVRGEQRDFESKSPGLGYSLRFAGQPNRLADVYIYDLRLTAIPDDIEAGAVREQFAQAKRDIFELERRGAYVNVREVDEFTVGSSGRTRFVCATFSYLGGEKRDREVDSYLCLTAWNNKFVKIRTTALKGAMSRADAANFVAAWIPLLSPSS